MAKSLATMAEEVMAYNHQMGWEPNPDQTFGDKIALGQEFSEALEAYRSWGHADATGSR
jgi:hypothetical protein